MNKLPAFLDGLDIRIFQKVESQTTGQDQRSLLKLQRIVSGTIAGYTYLEIGSYLGGTLHPHLLDPNCKQAISIDIRVSRQRNNWPGPTFVRYDSDNENKMLERFRLCGTSIEKLAIYRQDIRELRDLPTVDLAFIDAEHTFDAVMSDATHLKPFMAPDSIISFHDMDLIKDAVDAFALKVNASPKYLPSWIGAIGFGKMSDALAALH